MAEPERERNGPRRELLKKSKYRRPSKDDIRRGVKPGIMSETEKADNEVRIQGIRGGGGGGGGKIRHTTFSMGR